MDKLLNGLENIICYQDDILVISKDLPEHLKLLDKLFARLSAYNVKLNKKKCSFLQQQVSYLGHVIDKTGIHPTSSKVQAIKDMSPPQNVLELQVFLGMVNYYIKFIKNATDLFHPLYKLLKKNEVWKWTEECSKAFNRAKEALSSNMVLVHYDNSKPLTLACDASPYGLGVVLSHTINNIERPIAYASRTLTAAEAAYAQIEREALSIIFGLKHFSQYLYGRKFTIVTDHKPLLKLLGPNTETNSMAAARIQRWSLLLSSFNYEIVYKKGKEHSNADALSRFPSTDAMLIENNIYKLSYVDELPITGEDIRQATKQDATLGLVLNKIRYGWQEHDKKNLLPYFIRRDQLSVEDDCILWGMRIVIPQKYRLALLEMLHDTHPGMTRMKSVARSHIWWPNLDSEIENYTKNCNSCTQNQKASPVSTLQSWVWPKSPWERIHIDYAQKGKQYFLIIVDSHSKWIEVLPTFSITAGSSIKLLRNTFSRYGLPRELVSDNGPQFTSEEFVSFLKLNAIQHTLVPAYHPSSNGAAERSVQSFKLALEKMNSDSEDASSLDQKIARYLITQHSTPPATTGLSPSKLFLGREIRNRWSLLHTDLTARVERNQFRQKRSHDRIHSTSSNFEVGDVVLARSHAGDQKWIRGEIKNKQSNKTWTVETSKGLCAFHSDQLKQSKAQNGCLPSDTPLDEGKLKSPVEIELQQTPLSSEVQNSAQLEMHIADGVQNGTESDDTTCTKSEIEMTEPRRNPPRNRKPPDKLNL